MITLTAPARERIQTFLANQTDAIGVRLGVTSTGCSGHGYHVEVATELRAGERTLEVNGVPMVVATADLPLLEGTVVDYRRDGLREGFAYANPNATGTCGCGASVTFG